MTESLLVDELRDRLHEDTARGQFKTPPEPADERLEQLLSRALRSTGRRGGMSVERAKRMAADASAYDASITKGDGS